MQRVTEAQFPPWHKGILMPLPMLERYGSTGPAYNSMTPRLQLGVGITLGLCLQPFPKCNHPTAFIQSDHLTLTISPARSYTKEKQPKTFLPCF